MLRQASRVIVMVLPIVGISAAAMFAPRPSGGTPAAQMPASPDPMVLRGRELVISHACGECHGGGDDPAAEGWLAGSTGPLMNFRIGPPPCGIDPAATDCFTTRPRNLTPDATGMGHFTERQIFNALRYGLRPEDTPDVEITSTTPGEGNFPLRPHYLAPPMPWPAWRHMRDEDLRAIAAYLKRGLKPVVNKVPDSEGPPDYWRSAVVPEAIGTYPAAPFPAAGEVEPPASLREQVLRGRAIVLESGCADCHMGVAGPHSEGWLAGVTSPNQDFVIGECFVDPDAPCFHGRAKNLTPDPGTGIGRYSDRQIFNALRYGLRPGDTPDAEITSMTPGHGGFPEDPRYLGPFMPWAAIRYWPDDDLRAIIAYLRHGLKPVANDVAASDDAPDHWAGAVATYGAYPAPAFPTANEVGGM